MATEALKRYDATGQTTLDKTISLLKRSPLSLGNTSLKIRVEGSLQSIGPYIDDFLPQMQAHMDTFDVLPKYFMKPRHWCHRLYGCGDWWWLVLWINGMKHPLDFIAPSILAPSTNAADLKRLVEIFMNIQKEIQNTVFEVDSSQIRDMMMEVVL
jgi:hypothetical protein